LEREVAEATQQLQKAVEQLNQSARSAAEKFDGHMTAQLNLWSSQFKNHLDGVSREKAARFTTDLEQNLSSYLQDADEALEKLTAGLQLMQGTVRLQEERLAELSRAASAGFEKEIKSLLVRLADSV
jgi:DNA anti-recombination protein RmuC